MFCFCFQSPSLKLQALECGGAGDRAPAQGTKAVHLQTVVAAVAEPHPVAAPTLLHPCPSAPSPLSQTGKRKLIIWPGVMGFFPHGFSK